jgi:hypothetical protein
MRIQPLLQIACSTGIILAFDGCALYTNTQFTEYRGPSELKGDGGTVRTVDGIDVWQTGTPNRKYKVLGLIQQSHYDNHSLMSTIASVSKDSEIIKQAKVHGGDAVIILGTISAITGYTTYGVAQGTQSGTLSGYGNGSYYNGTYSGSSSAFGIANTHANTRTDTSIAVIKYLE